MRKMIALPTLIAALSLSGCAQVQVPAFGTARSAEAKATTQEEKAPPLITSLQWVPNYQPPIRQLEALLRNQEDAREMAQTISNIAYLQDARLYVKFHELLDYLPDTARVREVEEQNAWLDRRQQQVGEVFHRHEGGDLGSYHAADAFIAITRDRMAVIEQRLEMVRVR